MRGSARRWDSAASLQQSMHLIDYSAPWQVLNAGRATHAAAAANEAAALRRIAAAWRARSSSLPRAESQHPSDPNSPVTLQDSHGSTAAPPPPIVQLRRAFAARSAQSTGAGTAAVGRSRPAAEAAVQLPARCRCLVLERLGPTAGDLLARWQACNAPAATPAAAPSPGIAHAPSARGRQPASRSGAAPGGLPPDAVCCFAAQSLAALDLLHRYAGGQCQGEDAALRAHACHGKAPGVQSANSRACAVAPGSAQGRTADSRRRQARQCGVAAAAEQRRVRPPKRASALRERFPTARLDAASSR
jgi:hypothetical protein